ncbi:MAG: sodium-dependent transporter [Tissierellia bacterium]|nr:sodium-dependent transporter [Tissierellia bacterium]
MKKRTFSSHWGFVLACVGSAVGMANVWGFPFRMGTMGGGAFLIAYLFFVSLFALVALSAEYAIGRRTGTGTLGSYEYAWKKRGLHGPGKIIGWIPLLGSLCIALGYSVIVAYVLKALVQSLTGSLMIVDPEPWFNGFSLTPYSVPLYHAAILVIVALSISVGAKSIEKTNQVMMPLFFILFCILAIRMFFLPGSKEGYAFMFQPRWEELKDPMIWIYAMGQAFFSLSVTGSGMIVYGAYLPKDEDVLKGAINTAIFDTIAALVAALVIIPACFGYGVDVGAGPGLLFVTLPTILQDIYLGRIFAIILFFAVVFGGISSLQNMFEVVIESFHTKFPKISRKIWMIALPLLCFVIGINMEAIYQWGPWMDFVSIYIIPIGALLGAITWFWILPKDDLMDEIETGGKPLGLWWHNLGRYLYVPLALILTCIALFKGISF